jgi:aminoglycoside phosphotransferase
VTIMAADLSRSAVLMDPEQAKRVFQRQLPAFAAAALQIERCTILHTRYRTSSEDTLRGKAFLSVCYQVEVRDPVRANRGVQVLHLKAYPSGKSQQKFERARRGHWFRPRFGEAVAHLPELDAVVWAFPNDPKLPHLPEVIDALAVKRHLPYAYLPAGLDSPASIREVQVEVVRYKPEVRCTTRYELQAHPSAEPDRLVVYGKTFGHNRAAEISSRMQSLSRQSAAGGGHQLRVARALGYSEAVKTVWQEGLPGTPLIRIINSHNYPDLLERAASGLVRFHRAEMAGLPSKTLEDDLEAIRAEVAEMARAFPRQAIHLYALVLGLERGLSSLEAHSPGLVHGDFLLKQLVLHEGQLGLCDFDNLSIADPIQDLANFVVDLHFQPFGSSLVDHMAATFLGSYAAQTARAIPTKRLQWHCRLHVLRNAYYFYKRRHWAPRFEEELARILERAEQPDSHA